MEKVISFRNNENLKLFGILHIPENEAELEKRIGINLLNPGLKNRVAPNRLNVKLARMLCDMGYYVLRFDPFGIGDSEGELSQRNDSLLDLWGAIQQGLFIEDTIQGNSYLISEAGVDKLVLIGQCGAAVTAGLTGSVDERISHLILIDTPFRITSSKTSVSEAVAETFDLNEFIVETVKGFLRFDWKNRIFSKDMALPLLVDKLRIIRKLYIAKKRSGQKRSISHRFNHALANSLADFLSSGRSIYFLFAENDFSLKEFTQDYRYNFLENNPFFQERFSIDIIDNANHIYTEAKWQNELKQNIADWLTSVT